MAVYARKIQSVCPVCRSTIDGEIYERDDKIYLKKECPEHGPFQDFIHGHAESYKWNQTFLKDGTKVREGVSGRKSGCPHDCGLCETHINTPAIALVELTNRCNLRCHLLRERKRPRPRGGTLVRGRRGANWLIVDEKSGELGSLHNWVDLDRALALSKDMWSKIVAEGKQFGAPTLYRKTKKLKFGLGLLKYRLKKGRATDLLMRLVLRPSYGTVEAFMFGPSVMIGCMHFQDLNNLDTERTKRCLVHCGFRNPRDGTIEVVPFCTLNSLHRERIEAEMAQSPSG